MDLEDKIIQFIKKNGNTVLIITTIFNIAYFIVSSLLQKTQYRITIIPIYISFLVCFCHIKKDPYFNMGDTIWLGLIVSLTLMLIMSILLILDILNIYI